MNIVFLLKVQLNAPTTVPFWSLMQYLAWLFSSNPISIAPEFKKNISLVSTLVGNIIVPAGSWRGSRFSISSVISCWYNGSSNVKNDLGLNKAVGTGPARASFGILKYEF